MLVISFLLICGIALVLFLARQKRFKALRTYSAQGSPILGLISLGCFAGSFLALGAFYFFYWKWRDCFNELGTCVNAEAAIYSDSSGLLWGTIFAVLIFAGTVSAMLFARSYQGRGRKP